MALSISISYIIGVCMFIYIYIYTHIRDLQSFPFLAHCVYSLLPKATFTPSFQPRPPVYPEPIIHLLFSSMPLWPYGTHPIIYVSHYLNTP